MLERIRESCEHYPDRNAFYIRKTFYTYRQFAGMITAIRLMLRREKIGNGEMVGVIANDDLETYASVFALWLEDCIFVPISTRNPGDRNLMILQQTSLKAILNSRSDHSCLPESISFQILRTDISPLEPFDLHLPPMRSDDLLYILFTSGSTGIPKGVQISRRNFDSFLESFIGIGYRLSPADRFLQIYDLTFDASLHCYVLPLCFGACVYTVPPDEVKYTYAMKLMRDHELTFAKMPPSMVAYLRPYFKDIHLPKMRYSLFGGEPLYADLAIEWQQCVPNAWLQNVYGPTEATINCTYYDFIPGRKPCKSYNGIVSIGRPFGDSRAVVIDGEGRPVQDGTRGELCVAGSQVSPGYYHDDEKTAASFFEVFTSMGERTYYRTGDMVMRDADGDIMYIGRIDNQVQIQGFRVEMGEIEFHARNFPGVGQVAAIPQPNEVGNMQIFLLLENCSVKPEELREYLRSKVPAYMWPARIIPVPEFPKTVGGKIDRKALAGLI